MTNTMSFNHEEARSSTSFSPSVLVKMPSYHTKDPMLMNYAKKLSPEEETALRRFRCYAKENGYCRLLEDGQPAVDDTTLLRFLRANNLDLSKTIDRFCAVQDWRVDHAISESYLHMDVQCYEDYRMMYAQWTGRCDREGLPLYVFPMKHFTAARLEAYLSKYEPTSTNMTASKTQTLPCHILAFHALYENMLKFVIPLCSELSDSRARDPISASTHIIDITGMGFGHFWKIKKYLQGAISIATTHYPETLGHIFIVGAPSSFAKVWEIIKKWFDPVSVSKILIVSPSETETTLTTYINPQSLPTQYGGLLSWEWGEPPNLEESTRNLAPGIYERDDAGVQQYLKGPVTFSGGSVHTWGTVNGKLRRRMIKR